MPMLGYGTGTAWSKKGEESKLDQPVIDGVKTAIKLEYTHLDGAESMSSSQTNACRRIELTNGSVQD
jgi:diketogulonate reductase-like aldo/keto reductase